MGRVDMIRLMISEQRRRNRLEVDKLTASGTRCFACWNRGSYHDLAIRAATPERVETIATLNSRFRWPITPNTILALIHWSWKV
jgi:hypothetical protein